jgi:hypothetical protein
MMEKAYTVMLVPPLSLKGLGRQLVTSNPNTSKAKRTLILFEMQLFKRFIETSGRPCLRIKG